MAAYLSPVFGAGAQLFTNQGVVLAGGKIATYLAGTTTSAATWTDSTQAVANANPIILDSAGRLPNEMWLQSNQAYKLILMDSANNILGTWDNVSGVNDVILTNVISEWVSTGLTPSYISATSFSVPGNNVASFAPNRRVQLAVTAGTIYGYVETSSFGGGITTVTVQVDSTVIDSGISSVNIGLLNSLNTSYPQQLLAMNAAISVASATTTPIGAALSANITITGTNTITAFDTELAGIIKLVKFSDVLTLTHNGTSLILPTAANITTAAGDQAIFRSLGSGNWECLNYSRASGYAFFSDSAATLQTGATAVTQAPGDNSTKIATDAYADASSKATHGVIFFTANGTWTVPFNITSFVVVAASGAGGGGAAGFNGGTGAGGGGAGAILTNPISVTTTAGTVYTATLGGGGAGHVNTGVGGVGTDGGTTALSGSGLTFPTLAGGKGGANPAGGAGGEIFTGSGTNSYFNGQNGTSGGIGGRGGGMSGGAGGLNAFGGSATANSGSGGGGGSSTATYGGGGNGAAGYILIVF